MPVWRMQCSVWLDTLFPEDAQVMTPHFNDSLGASDPDALADDLANGLVTFYGGTKQIMVKAYDAQGTKPVYPQAVIVKNQGISPGAPSNREISLCLSYYSQQNRPRYRGRLYVPCAAAGITATGSRPSPADQSRVAQLVPIFTGLGGVDVDWVVFSRRDNQPRSVTNWWVDNAWDHVRARGNRPTSRVTGAVSE